MKTSISPESHTVEPQSIQWVSVNPNPLEPPSAWMRYGTSPTEIILAISVVTGANAGIIGAIAVLVHVLVPIMRRDNSDHP